MNVTLCTMYSLYSSASILPGSCHILLCNQQITCSVRAFQFTNNIYVYELCPVETQEMPSSKLTTAQSSSRNGISYKRNTLRCALSSYVNAICVHSCQMHDPIKPSVASLHSIPLIRLHFLGLWCSTKSHDYDLTKAFGHIKSNISKRQKNIISIGRII